jgi:methylphosphotriester-DNA--protein-cysteine methyltransferase
MGTELFKAIVGLPFLQQGRLSRLGRIQDKINMGADLNLIDDQMFMLHCCTRLGAGMPK